MDLAMRHRTAESNINMYLTSNPHPNINGHRYPESGVTMAMAPIAAPPMPPPNLASYTRNGDLSQLQVEASPRYDGFICNKAPTPPLTQRSPRVTNYDNSNHAHGSTNSDMLQPSPLTLTLPSQVPVASEPRRPTFFSSLFSIATPAAPSPATSCRSPLLAKVRSPIASRIRCLGTFTSGGASCCNCLKPSIKLVIVSMLVLYFTALALFFYLPQWKSPPEVLDDNHSSIQLQQVGHAGIPQITSPIPLSSSKATPSEAVEEEPSISPPPTPPVAPPAAVPLLRPDPSAIIHRHGVCGDLDRWWNPWMNMNQRVLNRLRLEANHTDLSNVPSAPESRGFIMFDCHSNSCSGYADRLSGIMSGLLISILTKRVFLVDWPASHTAIKWATFDSTDMAIFEKANSDEKGYPDAQSTKINREEIDGQPIANIDLERYYTKPIIHIQARSMGAVRSLMRNPKYRNTILNRWGMYEDTIWGCLMNLFVQPQPIVLEQFQPQLKILQDPSQFVIGIQIRSGDARSFVNSPPEAGPLEITADALARDPSAERREELMKPWQNFFVCAKHLATRFNQAPQLATAPADAYVNPSNLRYFLLSDSVELRKAVLAKYGDLLIPTSLDDIGHVDFSVAKTTQESLPKSSPNELTAEDRILIATVGEHWLFAMCDYYVIHHFTSGFARTAASRALKPHNIYNGQRDEICALQGGYLTMDQLAEIGHGM